MAYEATQPMDGRTDTPGLLFIGGWGETGRTWRQQVSTLAPRFPTVTYDRRGLGRSLLVRSMLAELKEHLRLVYTPAYDPEANRIEWLWRVSRRVVTHNHRRGTFELLVADVEQHFQTLAQTPAEVLRHLGSPFAPEKSEEVPLPLAHIA